MFKGRLLFAALGLPLATLCQSPIAVPIPPDPFELVTGPIKIVDAPEDKQAAVRLLARARSNESMKTAGPGYRLKVSFTVSSGGQTEYDGDWEMEETYLAHAGTHWTAK